MLTANVFYDVLLVQYLRLSSPVSPLVLYNDPSVSKSVFTITDAAFSWLKAATTAFTLKTLLRHYAKRALTPQSLNVKLGPRRGYKTLGTNLVLGPPKKFYRRNPSGTLRDVHWYHLGDPKKVPGAPSQGFLIFLGFDKNITKMEIWL